MRDYIQGLQHILVVFDGCFDNGSQDGKVFGGKHGLELAGDFLFHLDITDCLF